MIIDRRNFLKLSGAAVGTAFIPRTAFAQERFITHAGPWRRFEIITRVDILKPKGMVEAWVPVPSVSESGWSKPLGTDWKTNAKFAKLIHDENRGLELVYLQWAEGEPAPFAEINSAASTRDRVIDFSRPDKPSPLPDAEHSAYMVPLISGSVEKAVREVAVKIVEKAKTDLGKAKAIYEWLLGTQACSPGGKVQMPLMDEFIRKHAGLNALYVELAKVAGLPARAIYGVRVAPSEFGYKSLGVDPKAVTRAQHCRAEVWLEDYGWTPVDVADVCKVMQSEPPAPAPDPTAKVASARLTLFGAWEGNWLAYNMANNVALPGFDLVEDEPKERAEPVRTIAYMMYPQGRTEDGFRDGLDPDAFKYAITAKEIPV
ncbi:MAG: transglutaminase-like domain-containing protein [Alphaproteobacteria bacterium]